VIFPAGTSWNFQEEPTFLPLSRNTRPFRVMDAQPVGIHKVNQEPND
jgi:hypothetical protein